MPKRPRNDDRLVEGTPLAEAFTYETVSTITESRNTLTQEVFIPKRRRNDDRLVEGEPLAAEAFTHETVTTITASGHTITQEVLVPLIVRNEEQINTPLRAETPINFADHSENINYEQPEPPRNRRVRDIIGFTV